MIKYIDADRLIDEIRQHKERVGTDGDIGKGYEMAHDHIIALIKIIPPSFVSCSEAKKCEEAKK